MSTEGFLYENSSYNYYIYQKLKNPDYIYQRIRTQFIPYSSKSYADIFNLSTYEILNLWNQSLANISYYLIVDKFITQNYTYYQYKYFFVESSYNSAIELRQFIFYETSEGKYKIPGNSFVDYTRLRCYNVTEDVTFPFMGRNVQHIVIDKTDNSYYFIISIQSVTTPVIQVYRISENPDTVNVEYKSTMQIDHSLRNQYDPSHSQYSIGWDNIIQFEQLNDYLYCVVYQYNVTEVYLYEYSSDFSSCKEIILPLLQNIDISNPSSSNVPKWKDFVITKADDYKNNPVYILGQTSNFSTSSGWGDQIIAFYFPNGLYDDNYNIKPYQQNPSSLNNILGTAQLSVGDFILINNNFTKMITGFYGRNRLYYECGIFNFYDFRYFRVKRDNTWINVDKYTAVTDPYMRDVLNVREELALNIILDENVCNNLTLTDISRIGSGQITNYSYDLVWND